MARWRTTGLHHIIQKQGRAEIFEDYHLRIGDVTADTNAPVVAPVHEQRFDETEIGAKFATVTELIPRRCRLVRKLICDQVSAPIYLMKV
jgi:hypothetical protein